jgi:HrpA-like RNA helicase
MRTFFQIHIDQPPGDVLIFLPGQEDIESLEASIKLYANQLPIDHPAVRSPPSCASDNKLFYIIYFLTAGADMYHVRCSRAFAE